MSLEDTPEFPELPETPESPEIEMAPAEPTRPRRGFQVPLAMVVAGVMVLAGTALFDERWAADQAWIDALLLPKAAVNEEGRIPVWVRDVQRTPAAKSNPVLAAVQAELDHDGTGFKLLKAETVVAADLSVDELAPLVDSGRAPRAGKPEVLAGELASEEPFQLDGQRFTIVGRLKQGVSGFPAAYLLPLDPGIEDHFTESAGAAEGSLFLDGMARLKDLAAKDTTAGEARVLMGGQVRAKTLYAWGAVAGLFLVAVGGAILYVRFFAWMAAKPLRLIGPILRECIDRPRLLAGMHVLLYGTFFAAMAAGMLLPYWNYRITEYMGLLFTKGDLSYVGEAYASGDILKATAATFVNNYVVQTLGLTFAVSIFPLPLGVLKSAMSFAVVGFGMAPLWSGAATGYAYHSITMALELEAYIIACFAVTVWPIRLWHAFRRGPFAAECLAGLRIFFGGAVLAGVMLAVAALYEATTLILFRGL